MTEPSLPILAISARSAWVRLRTLILLRWLAVGGQSAAVLVASLGLGIRIPHLPCAVVIGASAGFNAVAMTVAAENRRLSEREAVLTLIFDLCQLGALLYLTGGLGNPFALLIMAPVTISASVLSLRATVLLAAVAAAIITLLAQFYIPLELASGEELALPEVLAIGSWTALLTGTAFLAIYARRVTDETFSMSQALAATQMALAREQQLSALGGVVAAAAHELGTPLATIKLAATELVEELADRPHLQEDAQLVRGPGRPLHADPPRHGPARQGGRAGPPRPVLHRGRGGRGAACRPRHSRHQPDRRGPGRGRPRGPARARAPAGDHPGAAQPDPERRRLRPLARVWIDLDWTDTELRVVIGDDGPGYPPDLIGRIGDPFVRRRAPLPDSRPGYEGMGLGLFIAKTLLERSGAALSFQNGAETAAPAVAGPPEFARPGGAVVTVIWPRARVSPRSGSAQARLGANAPVQG